MPRCRSARSTFSTMAATLPLCGYGASCPISGLSIGSQAMAARTVAPWPGAAGSASGTHGSIDSFLRPNSAPLAGALSSHVHHSPARRSDRLALSLLRTDDADPRPAAKPRPHQAWLERLCARRQPRAGLLPLQHRQGLSTLGQWLTRLSRAGDALDNLLSVELVLADGRVVRADEKENDDLFWALRGGGGNFGVATTLEYRLHEVGPAITGGLIAYPFEDAWDVLRYFRDVTAKLPDEFTVFGGLVHAPDGSGAKLAAIVLCHCGTLVEGERAVQPIKTFGKPAMDAIAAMPYSQMNSMLDAAYPQGAHNYWKSNFLAALTDEAIRTMIDCFAKCPTPMGQLLIEHFHGAVTRVGPTATAFPHRAPGYNLLVLSEWVDPAQNEACIKWARDSYGALQPFMGTGRYVNYFDNDEQDEAVVTAYGPNYRRLQQVKTAYDPENFFRMNQNIPVLAQKPIRPWNRFADEDCG